MAILSLLPATKDRFHSASQEFVSCFDDRGIFSSALGAFLLGVGMSLSGAVSCSHRIRGRLITDPCGLRNADNVYLLDYSRPLHINQVIYLIHKTEHEN